MIVDNIEGWPWLPHLCPPDKYFIDWMKEQVLFIPKMILHVGTGLHHKVGIECCAMGHQVLGVTVSREEVVSRVFRVDTPSYQVFYANINTINGDLLPDLDIATMFHFGEMESDFGPADIVVLHKLIAKLPQDGHLLFYNRSAAWDRANPVITSLAEEGFIRHSQTYEELEIYQRC